MPERLGLQLRAPFTEIAAYSLSERDLLDGAPRLISFDVTVPEQHPQVCVTHQLHCDSIRNARLPKERGVGVTKHVRGDMDAALARNDLAKASDRRR